MHVIAYCIRLIIFKWYAVPLLKKIKSIEEKERNQIRLISIWKILNCIHAFHLNLNLNPIANVYIKKLSIVPCHKCMLAL